MTKEQLDKIKDLLGYGDYQAWRDKDNIVYRLSLKGVNKIVKELIRLREINAKQD